LADIEGSSGCGSYRASSFLTKLRAHACAAMSLDVDAVVKGLFDAGVQRVTVEDFHRTGYNLLPEMIDGRARIVCGYHRCPVPGLGDPGDADDLHTLYTCLIRLCYLPPLAEKTLPFSLDLYNRVGRPGRLWVRRRLAPSPRD
jgi:hypothetical protein